MKISGCVGQKAMQLGGKGRVCDMSEGIVISATDLDQLTGSRHLFVERESGEGPR